MISGYFKHQVTYQKKMYVINIRTKKTFKTKTGRKLINMMKIISFQTLNYFNDRLL